MFIGGQALTRPGGGLWSPLEASAGSDQCLFSSAAGNNVEVDESLFQDIEDLDLDEDDPDFDPLQMGSDED